MRREEELCPAAGKIVPDMAGTNSGEPSDEGGSDTVVSIGLMLELRAAIYGPKLRLGKA